MKRIFLLMSLIVFLCVTFASTPILTSTETKAFAFGDRAFKVTYDRYLDIPTIPIVYEMTDTGRVKLDDKNLGIYFLWKHLYWSQNWKYWTDYWSETLSEIFSRLTGAAMGTLLIEGESVLHGIGISLLIGDTFTLEASLPTSAKAVFEAGKLVSITLGLTSAGLNTIANTLTTDRDDFLSIYLAMSAVEHNSLKEARALLESLEKKREAVLLTDSEIKLIDTLAKIMNLQISTVMMVLEPATLSTVIGLLEIIDDSLLDLATVKLAPSYIKEDAEDFNAFLNASIIHIGLLIDLSKSLDKLQSEILSAEIAFDSARMARAVMRSAATENAYYRVMAGYIRLHRKYLGKEDSSAITLIDSGLSSFKSFVKNVGYYLGSDDEPVATDSTPLPVPSNLMPSDNDNRVKFSPSYSLDWVMLTWEIPGTEKRVITYDVLAGKSRDSLAYVARELTERLFVYSGLQGGKDYYWKVIARDTMGGRSESPIWKFSTAQTESFIKTTSGIEMVYVEGGTFTMGDTWGDGDSDEKPTHKVTLTYNFYIGNYETTFNEYDAFCEATGRIKPKDEDWGRGNRPVVWVSWWDAIAYCNWLSEKEGLPKAYNSNGDFLGSDGKVTTDPDKVVGYRLPTEAEWEYAARGGKYSKGYKYSGSNGVQEVAWFSDNSGSRTRDIGRRMANELGIYDMSGNVWEWCSDWYGLYTVTSQIDPYSYKATSSGSRRVYRGGGWSSSATYTRVADRFNISPTYSYYNLGFRIARTVH
ncbi:formylglycine-generating enzyme family protein [Mesotoga prima]|mgnify:FL=1|uniref:formylglycine-generating enzyme family protein n=1 Tax=Mesotoga prima TaxID=1184387 RepID=UPI002FE05099